MVRSIEKIMLFNCAADFFSDNSGHFFIGFRQDESKLFAPVSGHEIILAKDGSNRPAELLEDEVTVLVTITVVKLLKVVNICQA